MNKMISSPILVLNLLLISAVGISQTTAYSESSPYIPRENPAPPVNKKKSKKDNNKPERAQDNNTSLTTPVVPTDSNVTIPVLVLTKNGKVVSDLRSSDFTVYINDKEVPISAFDDGPRPTSVIFLLDASPSAQVTDKNIENYVAALVTGLPQNIPVAIFQFDDKLKVVSDLTSDRDLTIKSIKKVEMGDGTSLYSTIAAFYQQIVPNWSGSKVVFLLTDGVDTTSTKYDYVTSLAEAEKYDVTVFPIYLNTNTNTGLSRSSTSSNISGVNTIKIPGYPQAVVANGNYNQITESDYKIGKLYLHDLASLSGGTPYDEKQVNALSSLIADQLNHRYFLTFPLAAEDKPEHMTIKVRVNRPDLIILARGSLIK